MIKSQNLAISFSASPLKKVGGPETKTLPAKSRDALLDRLDRVRGISRNLGYGVGDAMDDIVAEYM